MSLKRISTRYAKSLISLAKERGELEKVHDDVQLFQEVAKNKDFASLLRSPIINVDKKRAVVKALFGGKTTELTEKFLNIVLTKGREAYLPAIMSEYIEQYKSIKGVSNLTVTSAEKLSDAAIEAIKQKLIAQNAITSNVEVVTKVDPKLIGGFILEFGDELYDASIARKLNILKKDFTGNLYVSQIIAK